MDEIIRPWRCLKYGDPCWVRNVGNKYWQARIFAGAGNDGRPTTIAVFSRNHGSWDECLPFVAMPNENTEK